MLNLRQISIKAKLTLLTMFTSGVALLLSVTLLGINDVRSFRQRMERDLQTLADVIGASATSALEFDYDDAATKTLAALERKPGILAAASYKKDDKLFATCLRSGQPEAEKSPARGTDEFHYVNGRLHVFRPIERGSDRIGTIFFRV